MGYFDEKNTGAVNSASLTGITERNKRNQAPESLVNSYEYLYSFRVKYKSSLDDKNIQDISDGFSNLKIFSKFDSAKFPDVIMQCVVSDQLLKNIQDDYRKATIYITIMRFCRLEMNEFTEAEEVWSDKEFRITEISHGNLPNDMTNNDPKVEDKLRNTVPITFTLVEKDTIGLIKEINSLILNNCTMTDVIGFLIGKFAPKMKVSLQELDNTEKYEQVYIPPVDFFKIIAYLDDTYGLYSYGHTVFCDNGELILVSKAAPEVTKDADISQIDINIFQAEEAVKPGSMGMTVWDEDNNKIEINYGFIPISNIRDVMAKVIIGKDVTIATRNSSFSPEGGAGIKSDEVFDRQSYFWLDSSSKFAEKNLELAMSEGCETIQLKLVGTLFEYFTPKLLYNVKALFEVAEGYKGKYRVSRVFTEFQKTNSDVEINESDSNTSKKVLSGFMTTEFTSIELLKIK
jgi:hypothetical protein